MHIVFYLRTPEGEYQIEYNRLWIADWSPLSYDISYWAVPGTLNLKN